MIELNEDNDPMLFSVGLPCGQLIVQYMECLATLQSFVSGDKPTTSDIARAVRESARTTDVARNASDAMLVAAWHRMSQRIEQAGNG